MNFQDWWRKLLGGASQPNTGPPTSFSHCPSDPGRAGPTPLSPDHVQFSECSSLNNILFGNERTRTNLLLRPAEDVTFLFPPSSGGQWAAGAGIEWTVGCPGDCPGVAYQNVAAACRTGWVSRSGSGSAFGTRPEQGGEWEEWRAESMRLPSDLGSCWPENVHPFGQPLGWHWPSPSLPPQLLVGTHF